MLPVRKYLEISWRGSPSRKASLSGFLLFCFFSSVPKHEFWHAQGRCKSSGHVTTSFVHGISVQIEWNHSQTPKQTKKPIKNNTKRKKNPFFPFVWETLGNISFHAWKCMTIFVAELLPSWHLPLAAVAMLKKRGEKKKKYIYIYVYIYIYIWGDAEPLWLLPREILSCIRKNMWCARTHHPGH